MSNQSMFDKANTPMGKGKGGVFNITNEAKQRRFFFQNPVAIVKALGLLIIVLVLTGSGGIGALSRFGAAIGSIPPFVWFILIVVFFWQTAQGGVGGLRKR